MIELAHAATGGLIAYKIGNPLLSLPLAFASHFLIDLLPHWNPHLGREKKKLGKIKKETFLVVILDCLAGLAIGLYLASLVWPNAWQALFIIGGCFAGILPDLIEAPYYFFNWKSKLIKRMIVFQEAHHWNVPFLFGVIFQLAYVAFLFYLV